MFFAASFELYFSTHIDCNLLWRWAVPQSAIFCISYWLEQPGILLMCVLVSFLVISSTPTITGTIVVLRCHIFSISISRCLHLLVLLYSLIDILSVGTDMSIRRYVFLLSSVTGLFLFIFQSIWIVKSQRIVVLFASVIGPGWCLYHFLQSNILQYFHTFQRM